MSFNVGDRNGQPARVGVPPLVYDNRSAVGNPNHPARNLNVNPRHPLNPQNVDRSSQVGQSALNNQANTTTTTIITQQTTHNSNTGNSAPSTTVYSVPHNPAAYSATSAPRPPQSAPTKQMIVVSDRSGIIPAGTRTGPYELPLVREQVGNREQHASSHNSNLISFVNKALEEEQALKSERNFNLNRRVNQLDRTVGQPACRYDR